MEKLRTIKGTIEALRVKDPDTALTEWALRQLAREGKIPVMMQGNKYLLSLESVERYVDAQFGGEAK